MRRNARWVATIAAALVGGVLGATLQAGTTLLIYVGEGLLETVSFLIALTLASLAAGLCVGVPPGPWPETKRRWMGVMLALAVASLMASVWAATPGLGGMLTGRAMIVVGLLASPAYAMGALLAALAVRGRAIGAVTLLGVAVGVALTGSVVIPAVEAEVLYRGAMMLLITAGLFEGWWSGAREAEMDWVVLITGVGGQGQLGYALAESFLAKGASIAVTGMRPEVEVHAKVLEAAGPVLALRADLTKEEDVERVVAAVAERYGRLDALVNAAGGLTVIRPLGETSLGEWDREMERNARTTFLMSRAALPLLRASRGAIVNLASPAGIRARGQLGAYSAAKAAVVAMTRALALEEAGWGVRVNAVAPGMVDTEQNRQSVERPDEVRWVTREQVAEVVVFLASRAGAGVSGETVHVPGEGVE